jgi:RNA polymerase sigma-70 factor, ECF subfamily
MTTSTPESDAELAARFESDVMPCHPALLRQARRLTHTEVDAEDLVQDTLLRAFSAFRSFETGTNLNGWLFRIQRNQWINNFRHRQRRPVEVPVYEITDHHLSSSCSHQAHGLASAESEVLRTYPDADIKAALETVPERFRTAVYYTDMQGHTYAETAALLHIPIGTVMSRVFRGRQRLRIALEDAAITRGISTTTSSQVA